MLHAGAAEHDVEVGPGLIEEDVDVVDEDPDEAQLTEAPFFVNELEDSWGPTTPERRRQSTPNHCRHPLRWLIRCRSSHASRRCASSTARVRQSREILLPAKCHRWEFCHYRDSQSTAMRCGLLCFNKVWQRVAHAPRRSLIDCDGHTESKRSSMRTHSTIRQGEEWDDCLSLSR